jgi:hypothetical protein
MNENCKNEEITRLKSFEKEVNQLKSENSKLRATVDKEKKSAEKRQMVFKDSNA